MRHGTRLAVCAIVLGLAWPVAAVDVVIAPDGMLEIDGQRTFIIGLYENPKDDEVLEEAAQAGFNLVRGSADAAALDRLHAQGLYAWVNTGGRIDLGEDGSKPDTGLREMIEAVGAHPALLVWEVPDEALWGCWLKAYRQPLPMGEQTRMFRERAAARGAGLVAGYKALKQLDPKRPIWMNHAAGNSIAQLAAFGKAADLVGCDIYPLMPYPTRPIDVSRSLLAAVGVATTHMQDTAPGKPVWMVLQGAGWVDFNGLFGKKNPDGQQPTFHESRFMAYDAIVRGARAVLYWGTHYVEKDTPFWQDLIKVVRDLAAHQSLLSAPDAGLLPEVRTRIGWMPFGVKDAPIGVRALGKDVDGQVWWLVVNEYPFPVTCMLSGLADSEGTTYTDTTANTQAIVEDGKLTLPLPRYGVHILRPPAPKE